MNVLKLITTKGLQISRPTRRDENFPEFGDGESDEGGKVPKRRARTTGERFKTV